MASLFFPRRITLKYSATCLFGSPSFPSQCSYWRLTSAMVFHMKLHCLNWQPHVCLLSLMFVNVLQTTNRAFNTVCRQLCFCSSLCSSCCSCGFGNHVNICVCPHMNDPAERLICMHTTGGLTPGRNSRRQRHPRALDDEELFIIEGSPAATGAQLRDNREEREKCGKTAKKPFNDVTAKSQGRPTLSMNCNSKNTDHPVRVLHLRYFHSFLHCLHHTACRCTTTGVSQPIQELHLKNHDGLLHSLHCVPVSVKQLHHHSVDERKLRHLHVLDEDLLELVADDHRDVNASALPSICIPP